MLLIAAVQTLVPIGLLLWLSVFPARHFFLYVVQALSVGALLAAFALVGMWLLPPWWTPYLFGALFVVTVLVQSWRRVLKPKRQRSDNWFSLGVLGMGALFAAYAAYLSAAATKGRTPADRMVVNITSPFGEGTYLVAQGGSNITINHHYLTMDESIPRFAKWRGQSKGLDVIRIDRLGLRANGLVPENPENYHTFGTPVLAPCAGTVVAATDGVRDMPVPQMDRENMLGNHVIIDCTNFFIVLAHFRKGSQLVKEGQLVKIGDPLGEMGNSGNSGEPHLHIHAQNGLPENALISGGPLALKIDGKFLVRNDRITVREWVQPN